MSKFIQLFRRSNEDVRPAGFRFSRPLVLLQSDDWGRVGLRDHEGLDLLRGQGMQLGANPYDFYTLETADDVNALHDILQRHRDGSGRSACMTANFILANLDFNKMAAEDFRQIYLYPLTEGLPGSWSRPGLFDAYKRAIADGVIYPALHGLTHFCLPAAEESLLHNERRASILRELWQAQTPYIYWRMPWVGFEYCKPDKPRNGFLPAQEQVKVIAEAAKIFASFFSTSPLSACAPGYRANQDTRRTWASCGLKISQTGPNVGRLPYLDENNLLTLFRTLDFEPAYSEPSLEQCMHLAETNFAVGAPLIISIHSINFHSTVKNFRDPTLKVLDQFLSTLETKYPDLLYVHDEDLYRIVITGKCTSVHGSIPIKVQKEKS